MEWVILVLAGLFEIGWVIALKYSEGFSRLIPSIITVIFLAVSMVLLSMAMKKIPAGTAYAVWTGIGAAGTALLGILLFAEAKNALKLFFIALIICGVIGLKYSAE